MLIDAVFIFVNHTTTIFPLIERKLVLLPSSSLSHDLRKRSDSYAGEFLGSGDIAAEICDLYTIMYLSIKLSASGKCQRLKGNLSNAYLTSKVKQKKRTISR